MQLDLDGKTIAALINKGWTPPPLDYDAWRPALAAFNAARGYAGEAERVGDPDRMLLEDDRKTIDALALAIKAAPTDAD